MNESNAVGSRADDGARMTAGEVDGMTEVASPRAARLATPSWLDLRLVAGVLLVLLAVVAGARVFAGADRSSPVLVARHALVPGERLTAADLAVGRVRLGGASGRYLSASAAPPVGYVVLHYVGADELVPLAALSPSADGAKTRQVTVPVQPGHLPPDLDRGSLVDVYLTPKTSAGAAVPAPTLVLAGVPVDSRQGGARTFSADSALSVVLDVPAASVAALVHAVESGTLDLVAVPAAAADASASGS